MAGMIIGIGSAGASASSCVSWTGAQPPNPGTGNDALDGVAVLSACNAWGVGFYASGSTLNALIEHWNGHAWKVVPSPDPGTINILSSVRGISPSNLWAVGSYSDGTMGKSLILHWNGHAWRRVPSPNPGSAGTDLNGVGGVSERLGSRVLRYRNH
jgi:hypothetical protein